MRIYTEVNFKWNDKQGKLDETSSESFDYNGEMALARRGAGWAAGDAYYDSAGNHWVAENYVNVWGRITGERYKKNGKFIEEFEDGSGTRGKANTRFKDYVKGKVAAYRDPELYTNIDAVKTEWENTFQGLAYDDTLTTEQRSKYQTGEEQFTEVGVDALTEEEFNVLPANEQGKWKLNEATNEYELLEELYWTPQETKDQKVRIAEELIEGHIDRWLAIVDPDIPDIFQTDLRQATEAMELKETDIIREYEKFFGTSAIEGTLETIGETYGRDVERLTGKQIIDPITGEIISEGTFTAEVREALKTKEEGLEDVFVSREEELETVREEAVGGIRAAEAKIGAAGFAATGVGRTARDVLAEEIGEEARDIDVAFTEGREDITEDYTEALTRLKTGKATALEDYLTTGEATAKSGDDPWERATTAYEDLLTTYGTYEATSGAATGAILSIKEEAEAELTSILGDIRLGLEQSRDPSFGMESWDPFASGGAFYDVGQEMGWQYMDVGFDPTAATRDFGQTIEELLYKPTTGLAGQMYTPEYTLPWEEEESGGVPD